MIMIFLVVILITIFQKLVDLDFKVRDYDLFVVELSIDKKLNNNF